MRELNQVCTTVMVWTKQSSTIAYVLEAFLSKKLLNEYTYSGQQKTVVPARLAFRNTTFFQYVTQFLRDHNKISNEVLFRAAFSRYFCNLTAQIRQQDPMYESPNQRLLEPSERMQRLEIEKARKRKLLEKKNISDQSTSAEKVLRPGPVSSANARQLFQTTLPLKPKKPAPPITPTQQLIQLARENKKNKSPAPAVETIESDKE